MIIFHQLAIAGASDGFTTISGSNVSNGIGFQGCDVVFYENVGFNKDVSINANYDFTCHSSATFNQDVEFNKDVIINANYDFTCNSTATFNQNIIANTRLGFGTSFQTVGIDTSFVLSADGSSSVVAITGATGANIISAIDETGFTVGDVLFVTITGAGSVAFLNGGNFGTTKDTAVSITSGSKEMVMFMRVEDVDIKWSMIGGWHI